MKIGIDGRLINESGIGRYIRNLLENLALIDKRNYYYILLKKRDLSRFDFGKNFKNIEADYPWYSVSEQVKMPRLINSLKLDLIHFPHFNVPVFYKDKFIVTIHDLIHQHYTMNRATTLDPLTYKIKQFGYRKVFNFAVKKSATILVPSEFVKGQLEKEWQVDPGKIVVTPEGVDPNLLNMKNKYSSNVKLKVVEKIGINKPYIFYVGNAHPHKNVEGLIKSFRLIRKKYPKLKLVLSGADHYFWNRIKLEYQDPEIIYTGFVTDEVLAALFANAELFVMPSFEEGFGIPILESFANGCPVVCSDIGSLKEIGSDACIYFNPNNVDDIAEKINLGLGNEKLRKSLTEKGRIRMKSFSWKRLADQTLKLYTEG